jgi:hypothetical protein
VTTEPTLNANAGSAPLSRMRASRPGMSRGGAPNLLDRSIMADAWLTAMRANTTQPGKAISAARAGKRSAWSIMKWRTPNSACAALASPRCDTGTMRTSSSVVRVTMGIIMTPSAAPPAKAEKRCIGTTTML